MRQLHDALLNSVGPISQPPFTVTSVPAGMGMAMPTMMSAAMAGPNSTGQ